MKIKSLWILCAVVAVAAILLAVLLWPGADQTKTVGICYREGSSKENTAYRNNLENALNDQGYKVTVTDADLDQAKQLTQIQSLTDQGCDLLLIEPVMTDGAEELLAAVGNTGLPAVLINRQIDTELLKQYPQVYYIGNDDSEYVRLQVEMVGARTNGGDLNGDGTVSCLILKGPEKYVQSEQYERYFALYNAGGSALRQLSVQTTDGTLENGRKLCKQELAAYGKDIEVILCANDQIALGAAQAVFDGGRTVGKDVYLFGIGGDPDAISLMKEGKMTGTVYVDPDGQLRTICDTVGAVFSGQARETVQLVPYIAATSENPN